MSFRTIFNVWLTLALGGCFVSAPFVQAAGDPGKGKAAYEKYCLACHGAEGKGDGPTGKMLKPSAADFTSDASKKKPERELLLIIQNGKPGTAMQAWKTQLPEADITDVLSYIATFRNSPSL